MHRALRILIDVALVVTFAALGRASHAESLDLGGIARTAAPFLGGLLLCWIYLILKGVNLPPLREGLATWITTLALGMVFRLMVGDGVQIAFVLVAAATLGLFLVGWRGLWWLATRKRAVERARHKDASRSGNPAVRDEARRRR